MSFEIISAARHACNPVTATMSGATHRCPNKHEEDSADELKTPERPHILLSLIRALLRAKHGLSRRALRTLFISKHTHVFQWPTPRRRHSGVTPRLLSANWLQTVASRVPRRMHQTLLRICIHGPRCRCQQHCFPHMNTRVMHHTCITCHAVTHL